MLRNDILLNHKQYLYTIAGATIDIFLILVWHMTHYDRQIFRIDDYIGIMMFFFLFCAAFIGSSFPDLSSRKGTCNYLLLPSSILEKYLVQFFIRFVVFIPLALFIFLAATYLARLTANQINIIQDRETFIKGFSYISLISNKYEANYIQAVVMCFAIFSLGTFLFSARIFFKGLALMKTVILGSSLIFLFLSGLVILSHIFFPETHGFEVKINDIRIGNDLTSMELFSYYIVGLSWLFFISFGYFKLKEKQE
jgi:hypothetical protein